jgi:hypothetical protein
MLLSARFIAALILVTVSGLASPLLAGTLFEPIPWTPGSADAIGVEVRASCQTVASGGCLSGGDFSQTILLDAPGTFEFAGGQVTISGEVFTTVLGNSWEFGVRDVVFPLSPSAGTILSGEDASSVRLDIEARLTSGGGQFFSSFIVPEDGVHSTTPVVFESTTGLLTPDPMLNFELSEFNIVLQSAILNRTDIRSSRLRSPFHLIETFPAGDTIGVGLSSANFYGYGWFADVNRSAGNVVKMVFMGGANGSVCGGGLGCLESIEISTLVVPEPGWALLSGAALLSVLGLARRLS